MITESNQRLEERLLRADAIQYMHTNSGLSEDGKAEILMLFFLSRPGLFTRVASELTSENENDCWKANAYCRPLRAERIWQYLEGELRWIQAKTAYDKLLTFAVQ
jgi:hypothetical protein